jgi:5S rRNA maturation endonuclease (ribonuclease M5)
MLEKLIECDELEVSAEVQNKLLQISLGQVKAILKKEKTRSTVRIRGTTRPGTVLKHQIAIRYGPWEDVDPGFFEMDTVAHCGETVSGKFIYSLDLIDIASGWSEQAAIWGKGEQATLEQFQKIEADLPFIILGIDPDNGGEFINWVMYRYIKEKAYNFTRSRPFHKNDNAHIEQKNWTAVRQLVGYSRLDKPRQLDILNDLYRNEWRLYQNFFLPIMKLETTTKNLQTGKTKKKYDKAKTPYQRLLVHKKISQETKDMLKQTYDSLNPIKLRQQIKAKIDRLKRTLK